MEELLCPSTISTITYCWRKIIYSQLFWTFFFYWILWHLVVCCILKQYYEKWCSMSLVSLSDTSTNRKCNKFQNSPTKPGPWWVLPVWSRCHKVSRVMSSESARRRRLCHRTTPPPCPHDGVCAGGVMRPTVHWKKKSRPIWKKKIKKIIFYSSVATISAPEGDFFSRV